jgi:large subunit ribosomal protein L18
MKKIIKKLFLQKKKRYLKKIVGSFEKPRLSIFRSHKHIYAQLIDDQKGRTLASSSSLDPIVKESIFISNPNENEQSESKVTDLKNKKITGKEIAFLVGQIVAKKALDKNINTIVFDRGDKPYHGRIQEIARGAREKGLVF